MKNKVNTLLFIYNSYNDPLFQNILLSYIKAISRNNFGDFHVITFEQVEYHIDENEKIQIKNYLANYNIFWHPLSFHTGRFLIIKKGIDLIQSVFMILKLKFKYNIKVIFSFANVASSMAILIKKLFKIKMIVYSYEPHSEFMCELGLWNKRGIKFRILNYLEKLAGRDADYILTGTKYMVERLGMENSNAKVYRAPTAVDENDFYFRPEGRMTVREKIGMKEEYVILYLGKFGDLYYQDEIPKLSREIKKTIPNSYFLVVTSNNHDDIEELYRKYLKETDFHITGHLSYEEVKDYISASDLGISGVPPTDSQKYRSPTKVAEYLLCGIPYITSEKIAEDDIVAYDNEVGLVVKNFQLPLSDSQKSILLGLYNENREKQRIRCRETALQYRSRNNNLALISNIYEEIIG
ncbi:MAG: glycosyltransferase [Bacteroidota bacterium]